MRLRVPPAAIACALPSALCALLVCHLAGGQTPAHVPPPISVRGVVFDSVRGKPLGDAFVTILGSAQSTTTDARGRFRFDSVPEGVRTFAVQHAALDSLGFSGLSARAMIPTNGDAEVRVAVPSFATLWRSACGAARVPSDSGLLYGTIRDARTRRPVANASVELGWSEIAVRDRRQLVDRRWRADTRTSPAGDYAVCGVPLDAALRVRAATDSTSSGAIELPVADLRVQRRDLVLGTSDTAGKGQGIIVGLLTDPSGAPFADARVTIDDSVETHSDDDGGFVLRGVPTGSRQLVVRYVGITPVIAVVDVVPSDTTLVSLAVPKVTTLATVHVTSAERARMLLEEYEERKIMYHRYMIDSMAIRRVYSLSQVFYGLPNVSVKRSANGDFRLLVPDGRGTSCTPELRVDGTMVNDFGALNSLAPNRVVAVEVYPHAFDVPAAFQRAGVRYLCGLVAVWTKWAFRLP